MYTVREVIDLVSYTANDWPPERIILIINEIVREMQRGNTELAEYIDPTTGLPYMLATTDGTYFYAMPTLCRKIKNVLVRASAVTETYSTRFQSQEISYLNEAWYSLLNIKTWPKGVASVSGSDVASLIFPDNPGTTTGLYYVPYWYDPSEITSINSTIGVVTDYQGLLVEGVIARIQAYQYGNFDAYNAWKERMKLEVWHEYNYNPPHNNFAPSRPC